MSSWTIDEVKSILRRFWMGASSCEVCAVKPATVTVFVQKNHDKQHKSSDLVV